MEASVKEVVGFYWNQYDNSDNGTLDNPNTSEVETALSDDIDTDTIDERFALSGLADDGGTTDIDERYVSKLAQDATFMADNVSGTNIDESLYALAVPRSVSDHLAISGQQAPTLKWLDAATVNGFGAINDFDDILLALEGYLKVTPSSAVAAEFAIGTDTSTYIWIDSNGNGEATTKTEGARIAGQPITIVTEADAGDLYIKLVGVSGIDENVNHHLFISG
ncbi:MAG: hypothetical protein FD149_880 [Rhodospirillaceae bacterium]|nr:MAG: hypothetical protein FD149_880 [Rhodospirillaceae bacterium]